jgi:hypothetical protein
MLAFNVVREIKEQVKTLIIKDKDISDTIKKAINDEIRKVASQQKNGMIDYNMLTKGNVNLVNAASVNPYDSYGKVTLAGNPTEFGNENIYKRMKNKINYGSNTDNIARNRGQQKIVR